MHAFDVTRKRSGKSGMSGIKRKPPQSRGPESGFHGFGFRVGFRQSRRAMALAFVSPLVRVAGAPFSTNTEAPATILDSAGLTCSRYELHTLTVFRSVGSGRVKVEYRIPDTVRDLP